MFGFWYFIYYNLYYRFIYNIFEVICAEKIISIRYFICLGYRSEREIVVGVEVVKRG